MAELFDSYKFLDKPHGSRLRCAIGGSFVLHALFLACVLYVPTVRSMLHIVGIFADAEYVSEDYKRIAIRERDQVIFLSSPDGKFHYPPGYFSKGALVQHNSQSIAEAKPTPTPLPVKQPKTRPTPKPSPSPLPTPEATPAIAQNNQQIASAAPSPTPTPEDQQKAEQDLNKIAEENKTKRFPKINSKPFKDLLAKGKEMKDKGELDLNGTIQVTIEADRNEDGTLSNVVVVPVAASDKNMKELVKEFVQALSASRALVVLEGTRHLRLKLNLDEKTVFISVVTEVESEERAAQMARGYGGMLFVERWRRSGKNEAAIFNNTNISAQGKLVTVKFQMSRKAAGEMIAKQVPSG